MEYVPPINGDQGDPNRGYINKDPLNVDPNLRRGSQPPAAAIEHPMREITNVIAAAGLTPDGGDLTQLSQAIAALILANATSVDPATTTAAGIVENATVAEVKSETAGKNIIADNAKHINGVAKAFGSFNGKLGVSIFNSYGIASIVRNSSGVYTITISNALASAINNIVVTAGDSFAVNMMAVLDTTHTSTTTTVRIKIIEASSAGVIDADKISFAIFGELA